MNSITKILRRVNVNINRCAYVTAADAQEKTKQVREWHILKYGSLDDLVYKENSEKPRISEPTEVMIKVHAASVNPIDVAMIKGYGSTFLNLARACGNGWEFPLVLGRDFVGEVVQKGMNVPERDARLGQLVWGVVPVHKQGSHRDYVVVNKNFIADKPTNVLDTDATGFLYAGMTAWSGIFVSGMLGGPLAIATGTGGGKYKNVLVLGASGGVGSIATQILLAEQANVTATCSPDAIPFVDSLGAVPNVLDYTANDYYQKLSSCGPFDLVLDCAGRGPDYAQELPCTFHTYVTFSSPTLRNMDDMGLIAGNVKNLADLFISNIKTLGAKKAVVKWAYFIPAPQGLKYLGNLVRSGQLTSVTSTVFHFENANLAYKRVEEKHLRGKIVLDFMNSVPLEQTMKSETIPQKERETKNEEKPKEIQN
uniref:CSON009976 protein n=1 Tax=Culicoides sonorensis TaxID=179676 RepID=A0A336LU18_CULSO